MRNLDKWLIALGLLTSFVGWGMSMTILKDGSSYLACPSAISPADCILITKDAFNSFVAMFRQADVGLSIVRFGIAEGVAGVFVSLARRRGRKG